MRRYEVALVVLVAAALYVPGITSYSLVDPWETHYGEVAREMRQNHDYLHTTWTGTSTGSPGDIEGFRSKPVLTFWLMAAGMTATGVGAGGGFSGEMVESTRTMIAIRLPIIACAIAGLVLVWLMLARLVSRRLAWLAVLVVGTMPMFCMVARQGIPDMPLVSTTMGAIALLIMAIEDGSRPFVPKHRVVFALAGAFIVIQAIYFALYAGIRAIGIPIVVLAALASLSTDVWRFGRWPLRYVVAALPLVTIAATLVAKLLLRPPAATMIALVAFDLATALVWGNAFLAERWPGVWRIVDRLLAMERVTTTRQVYLVAAYFLLGLGILAKGPVGITIAVAVAGLHLVLAWRWRALYEGAFEVKRGVFVLLGVALPWHFAMYMREGPRFVDEYIFTHIVSRATAGVDNSPGTFEYYTSQLGLGMWLWVALLPAALATVFVRARGDTREGRVRVLVTLWAIASVFVFCFVQTKFHHYILPALPPLGIVVAFFVDDLIERRERLHWVSGALAIGIVLLVCRDLVFQPGRWIDMFIYGYNRAWPQEIDPSKTFLLLGALAVASIIALCISRLGVVLVAIAGIAIAIGALHVYMPLAGKQWGMREAFVTYYSQRTIYGYRGRCSDLRDTVTFETFVPDELHVGQPMTMRFGSLSARGEVIAIGDHDVTVRLFEKPSGPCKDSGPRFVDADRLIGWAYWRGELFWSGGEIWGATPELQTYFVGTNTASLAKYLARAPVGRRYFVISEVGRIGAFQPLLPTQRARDTFRVIDTRSNKFSLASFYL